MNSTKLLSMLQPRLIHSNAPTSTTSYSLPGGGVIEFGLTLLGGPILLPLFAETADPSIR